jgi:hypothetical protein
MITTWVVVFVWHGADRFTSLISPAYQRLLVSMQQRPADGAFFATVMVTPL